MSWNVDVDGRAHTISVHPDSESGRTAIRVDGRAAAKPMAPEDEEREVQVGSTRYLVRRLHTGGFDIDIAPVYLDPALAPSPYGTPQAPPAKKPVLKWILLGVALVIGAVFARAGWQVFQYSRVPWTPFSPTDGSFKAKFAGTPEEEVKSRNLNGDMWQITHLSTEYKNHYYGIEYVDVHRIVTAASAQPLIEDYFTRWAAALNATIVSEESTKLSENPAIRFVLRIPPSVDGSMPIATVTQGVVAIRNKRVFFVYAIAPESHKSMPDLRSFVSSFELQPPPPPSLKL